jgi:hypothetical protein
MELERSSSKSNSTKTLAYESLDMVEASLSLWIGFPGILVILERHLVDQHFRGKFGNFTQTGTLVIFALAKSKYYGIGFKINGLPYAR